MHRDRGLGSIGVGVLALVCACGGDEVDPPSPSEAATTGSSSGAGGGGGGGAPMGDRVLVRDPRGSAVPGVDVIVHDASGAVVAEATTGSDGEVDISLPEGGGVSLLWVEASTSDPSLRIASFVGLDPTTELRLVVERQPDPPPGGVMHLEFDVPSSLPGGGWNVEVSCYGESNLGEVAISYAGCASSSTFDVLVYYATGTRQLFAGEPFVAGQTRTFELDPTVADVAAPVEVTARGLAPDADWFSAGVRATRPEGGDNSSGRYTDPSAYDPTLALHRPWVAAGGRFDLFMTAGVLGQSIITRRLPVDDLPSVTTWTPAAIADVAAVGPVAGSEARPSVGWTLAEDGELGEAIRVTVRYDVPDLESGLPLTDRVEWSIDVAAAAEGSVTLPELPPRYAAWLPSSPYLDSATVAHRTAEGGRVGAINSDFDRSELSEAVRALAQPTIGR
jgi:hypothetical protein